MADRPAKRPQWNRLSASELERERARVREKERSLRQRLERQEQALRQRPFSRLDPQRLNSLEQLRQQVEGMQGTAQTLRARAQQR